MDHLVLIDGHHLMYRAYWALPRTLRTRAGEQTNTVFGLASMMLAILNKEQPEALLVCFDEGKETFRHKEAKDYKAGRAETPDDFYEQIPRVMDCLNAFGIRYTSHAGFEADDLLCAYARLAEGQGMRVTIVSGDRDVLQLASDRIQIAIPHKGFRDAEYLGPQEIEKKFGIRPDQVTSFKGLSGDSSDNLPGVRGVGPKTATKLLQQYGSLEGVYEHLEDIKSVLREKLETSREQAFFCKRMAELVCDMPLSFSLEELQLHNLPLEHAAAFFIKMEFTILDRRLMELAQTEYGRKIFTGEIPALLLQKEARNQMTMF